MNILKLYYIKNEVGSKKEILISPSKMVKNDVK